MANPIHELDKQLRKWADVRELLAGEDLNEQEILDAIEGETDLLECLSDLDESLLENEAQLMGLNEMIKKMQARAERYRKTIESKRRIIQKAMEQAGLKTHRTAVGTLTIKAGKESVVVLEQAALPEKYLIPQDPKIDKAQLSKDLHAGENITGATLNNGPSSLTIRRS